MIFCERCDNVLMIRRKKGRGGDSKKKVLECTGCGHEVSFNENEHKQQFILAGTVERSSRDKTMVLNSPLQQVLVTEEDRESLDLEDGCWDEEYT